MHTINTIDKIELNYRLNEQAKQILEKFGKDMQATIICEELSELLTALFHYSRHKISKQDLLSEMSDVEMMLTQLKYIVSDTEGEYENILKIKLEKQGKLL